MTKQDLFDSILELVGGNKRSAIEVLLFIDDYLIDHLEGYCADDCTVDFGDIAAEQIDLMEKN